MENPHDNSDLAVLPASDPEAPPSSDYDVDVRPGGADAEHVSAGWIAALDKPRLVAGYVAGTDAENAGEAMVAAGPPEAVIGVLAQAGYFPPPAPADDAGRRRNELTAEVIRCAEGIGIDAAEVEPWRFELELLPFKAIEVCEQHGGLQQMVSGLATGLAELLGPDDAAAAGEHGPAPSSRRGRCRKATI